MIKKSRIKGRTVQLLLFVAFVVVVWLTRDPLTAFINPKYLFWFDPFVMVTTVIAERVFLPAVFLSLTVIVLTFFYGRFFCSTICPLGAMQDYWAGFSGKVIDTSRHQVPFRLLMFKFYVLFAVIAAALFGIQLAWIFDPVTIAFRTISFSFHPAVNGAIDSLLVWLVMLSGYNPAIDSAYSFFKMNIAGAYNPVFPHSWAILAMFVLIMLLASYKPRFWCNYVCPAGAVFSICAKYRVKKEPKVCVSIKGGEVSRGQFLTYLAGAFLMLSGRSDASGRKAKVMRPPASLPENEFVQRCIRCGNCMKVCPTNLLQPCLFESGPDGIWTPRFEPNIGYCEFKCTLCGQVCPTDAIKKISVEKKMRTKMGTAVVIKETCKPWAEGVTCLVCEEHCPVYNKAIKMVDVPGYKGIKGPVVDASLCVGCAICENKCPVRPERAIRVYPG